MAHSDIATALARVNAVLRKRPQAGIVDDAPATSAWQGGLRVLTQHPSGAQATTDMPAELGGGGEHPSPGWLLRAAMASCAVTRIAMAAAEAGIGLHTLQASAHSRSDVRGLLGVPDSDGTPLAVGPTALVLRVQIGAAGVEPGRLQALVEQALALAPISQLLERASAVATQVEICAVATPAAA
jgi:uncharacterized OsmC-like protein